MALTGFTATTIQRQSFVHVAYQLQTGGATGTGLGNPSSGDGIELPLNTGHGELSMDNIPSLQIRQDGLSVRGRKGTQKTKGGYKSEMQAFNFDAILESVMRGTWTGGGSLGGSILVNPIPGALVRRYWTVEEYEADLAQSEVYSNVIWEKITMNMKPNGMISFDADWMGPGQADGLDATTDPTAPNFTSAVLPNVAAGAPVVPMAALDAVVTLDDGSGPVTRINLTDWSINLDLKATAPPVAGSRFSPDVFDGILQVGGTMKFMRADLLNFRNALAETPISMEMTATTPITFTGGTAQTFKITIPQFTLGSAIKSDFKRDGGPLEESVPFPSALVGVDDRGGAFPPTMVIMERSW